MLARLVGHSGAELVGQPANVDPAQELPYRGRADVGLERRVAFVACLGTQGEVLVLVEQLVRLDILFARLDHDVARVVDHSLEVAQGDVDQVAHGAGQRLEEPDVGHRHAQLDVAHALAPHLAQRHLDAAPVADHPAIADPLVLPAVALPVLDRTEDALAEEAVLLRLERPVIDRLRLGDLAPRPPGALPLQLQAFALLGVARPADLFGRGDANADVVETRALGLATATKINHDLFISRFGGPESHLETERLQFLHQYVERFGDAGLRQILPLHDRFVHLAPAIHVVRLDREHLLQHVRGAVRFQRPHFHLPEPLTAELRLTRQWLLGHQRVRTDRPGVDLVIYQVAQLQHVDGADGDLALEEVTGPAVPELRLARCRETRGPEQFVGGRIHIGFGLGTE